MNQLILIILCIIILINISYCEIIFVFELSRHGARAPKLINAQDQGEFIDKYGVEWKTNMGITPIGMRMQYLLGVRNRYKYSSLLSSIYDPKELLIFSSQLNRHIMSAQSQLQGMFPPQTGATLSKEELPHARPPNPLTQEVENEIAQLGDDALPEKVQIIPIHNYNSSELTLLKSEISTCPPLEKIKKELRKQSLFTDYYNKVNNTYGKQLQKYFKMSNRDFLYDYDNMFYLADTFISDYVNNRDLSHFQQESGINDLNDYYKLCAEMKRLYLYYGESNEFIGVMAASLTMKKIISWMEMRIQRVMKGDKEMKVARYEEPKFVMYSGGDTTMGPIQLFMKEAFGVDVVYPSFCSNVFFELHKKEGKGGYEDYYVEYYMDDELKVNISFSQFKNEVEKIMWSEKKIREYCFPVIKGKLIMLIIGGMVIILIALAFVLCRFYCNQCKGFQETTENGDDKGEELQDI